MSLWWVGFASLWLRGFVAGFVWGVYRVSCGWLWRVGFLVCWVSGRFGCFRLFMGFLEGRFARVRSFGEGGYNRGCWGVLGEIAVAMRVLAEVAGFGGPKVGCGFSGP